jgi:hypothetical protein
MMDEEKQVFQKGTVMRLHIFYVPLVVFCFLGCGSCLGMKNGSSTNDSKKLSDQEWGEWFKKYGIKKPLDGKEFSKKNKIAPFSQTAGYKKNTFRLQIEDKKFLAHLMTNVAFILSKIQSQQVPKRNS